MDTHIQELLYAIGSIVATVGIIYGMMRNMLKDIEERTNKRFDAVDKQLEQIRQNHLEHLTTLHAVPVNNQQQFERTSD